MSKKHRRASHGSGSAGNPSAAQVTIRASGSTEFNPDYSYVAKDLKKIGILALTFISILVALAFFLR